MEAPAELAGLFPWVFERFEDDEALLAALPVLAERVAPLAELPSVDDRAFVVDALDPLVTSPLPAASPGDPAVARAVVVLGASSAALSAAWPVVGRADLTELSDTAVSWTRQGEAAAFACLPEGCDYTVVDVIHRRTPIFEWTSTHHRAYRVVFDEADEEPIALVARSWITQVVRQAGSSELRQTWELEIWQSAPAGLHRAHAQWVDATYAGLGDELAWRADRDGSEDAWERTRAALESAD